MRASMAASASAERHRGQHEIGERSPPETGSHPSWIANRIASIGPSQKSGTDTPTSANVIAAWSTSRPRYTAASDAERQRDRECDQHRRDRQLEAFAEAGPGSRADRCAIAERDARDLQWRDHRGTRAYCTERLVEAERSRRAATSAGAAPSPSIDRRVAGHEMNQREHQRRDSEQHRYGDESRAA